jgi:hypothetical protein
MVNDKSAIAERMRIADGYGRANAGANDRAKQERDNTITDEDMIMKANMFRAVAEGRI